ncbi:MAG: hypothetical protein VX044_04445 [Planctomycetota bacterium]|jgi:hypothetical protein|nr:hypothetical protein [Planctomycetota bacterium]MEC8652303.1 hypothetical protein [Planctomycetota bacterium]
MYFCAVGLIALLPFAYLFCQVFTVVVYEGAWRWYCLAPLPLVVGGFCTLFYFESPVAFVLVTIGAPTVGMIALASVWGLYSKSAAEASAAAPDGAADNG